MKFDDALVIHQNFIGQISNNIQQNKLIGQNLTNHKLGFINNSSKYLHYMIGSGEACVNTR